MERSELLNTLNSLFPNARCELDYCNDYQLLIAIILSAQTTDKLVNTVTPTLFSLYSDFKSLQEANFSKVQEILNPIGLSKVKANNIISLAKKVYQKYQETNNYDFLKSFDYLITLNGVGRKTANVFLAEYYNIPSMAVDTHIKRVSKYLGLTKSNDVLRIEFDLCNYFNKEDYNRAHLLLLFFGRYLCKAKKPDCYLCPFKSCCLK